MQSYGEQSNLQSVLQGTEITAVFDGTEGQVHGYAGCNNYFGSYHIINNKLSIQEIAYTEMYRLDPEGVMEQEEQYLKALQAAESYEIEGGRLRITYGAEVLVFGTGDE
ncbi:MAG TPA: META domain-containing protein [Dehalococcoidia bacterium]|nr:META domain-containing protein [Dehalococcoidia bacterium]